MSSAHVSSAFVDKINGAGHVGVNDTTNIVEILIEKRLTKPTACIGHQRVDWTTTDRRVKLVYALFRCQICIQRLDIAAFAPELVCRTLNFRLVCDNDQIELVLRALSCKLKSDACGGACDNRKLTLSARHWLPPSGRASGQP